MRASRRLGTGAPRCGQTGHGRCVSFTWNAGAPSAASGHQGASRCQNVLEPSGGGCTGGELISASLDRAREWWVLCRVPRLQGAELQEERQLWGTCVSSGTLWALSVNIARLEATPAVALGRDLSPRGLLRRPLPGPQGHGAGLVPPSRREPLRHRPSCLCAGRLAVAQTHAGDGRQQRGRLPRPGRGPPTLGQLLHGHREKILIAFVRRTKGVTSAQPGCSCSAGSSAAPFSLH